MPVVRPLEQLAGVTPAAHGLGAWREWVTAALDLLFPPFCPVCRTRLGPGRRDPLCGACWQRLERIIPPLCRLCGTPLFQFSPQGEDDLVGQELGPSSSRAAAPHLCGRCRRRVPSFSYARSAARYGDVVREALHAFKFGGRRALAAPLGELLAEVGAVLPVDRVDLLVPVPLHPRRERERGFNQAALLARRLGKAWAIPVSITALRRSVDTPSQTELTAAQRRANVKGAFTLRRPELVAGRHVLIVDDIMTTGATAGECAACLKDGGAATVGLLTVARVL